MSPEQMQMLSDVLYEAVESEYRHLRDEGVSPYTAQGAAKVRVRDALRDLLLRQLARGDQ